MASTWRKALSRLAGISRQELQVRAGQEFSKRLDLMKHHAGLQPARCRLVDNYRASGNFFFAANELASRIEILREHLSAEVEAAVSQADEICRHRFHLLGYENLDYGLDIDWHLDVVHGKRAPLKPWYKIRFLDFAEVGDHKVIWELNRHQHLVLLAKAWCFTQKEKYVAELIDQWYGWQRANPYPLGMNWASSLEVAFRSLSWLWVRALLVECRSLPASFEEDCLYALATNGRHIERYLSTYFSPNTHLLGEATALFFTAVLCPQIDAAGRWQHQGWSILLREAERQVHPDGVYFEPSLYYHVYALDFLLHARLLAERNGIPVPGSLDATLNKMLNLVRAVSQAGPPVSFGDDDGGRVFDARRNRSEHLRDPLAAGAVLLGREDLKSAARLTEESVWLLGERALSLTEQPCLHTNCEAAGFESGAVYVMASCEVRPEQMVIHAGTGAARNGHAHADALSLTVSFCGQQWLIDPGTFCYVGPENERDLFRATAAHNALRVDGLDQAVPDGPFGWQSFPASHVDSWLAGNTFSFFNGSHDGYCRLPDPVVHRRSVFHLHGRFWLVRDVVEGRDVHDVEVLWHFAPGLEIVKTPNGFFAPLSPAPEKRGALALLPAENSGWSSELGSGHVAPVYGRKENAMLVRVSARLRLPAEQATLIVPLADCTQEPGKLVTLSASGSTHAYRYEHSRQTYQVIFAGPAHQTWSFGPWSSDARLLLCVVEHGRVMHLIACTASFVKMGAKKVFEHSGIIDRLEWSKKEGVGQIVSSDATAARCFLQEGLESGDPLL